MQQHAVENRGVEVIGLHLEGPLQIVLGPVEVSIVKERLAEEKTQLVIVAVELECLFERLHAAVGLEGVDGRLGLLQEVVEALLFFSAKERDDPVLPLREALLLLQGQHLLAHLRFPEVDQLLAGNDVLFPQKLVERKQPCLVHEDGSLVLVDGLADGSQSLGRPLHDLFERRHALEKMLVERYVGVFLVFVGVFVFVRVEARENEQLVLAAEAELAFVVVVCATGLAKHVIW